ncbi:hypothetical protein [Escherichia phage UPEC06]|nr:hypothetical protein [Escherichia phage UPEC06]
MAYRKFDPLIIYEVVPMSIANPHGLQSPTPLDHKTMIRNAEYTLRDLENEEIESAVHGLKDLIRELDTDDSVQEYIEKSEALITKFHEYRTKVSRILDEAFDPSLKDPIKDDKAILLLSQIADATDNMDPGFVRADHTCVDQFPLAYLKSKKAFGSLAFVWEYEKDSLTRYINRVGKKDISVTLNIFSDGSLMVHNNWTKESILFGKERDQKFKLVNYIRFATEDSKMGKSFKEEDFKTFFEDWLSPTEEEIQLFKAVNGDVSFDLYTLFNE